MSHGIDPKVVEEFRDEMERMVTPLDDLDNWYNEDLGTAQPTGTDLPAGQDAQTAEHPDDAAQQPQTTAAQQLHSTIVQQPPPGTQKQIVGSQSSLEAAEQQLNSPQQLPVPAASGLRDREHSPSSSYDPLFGTPARSREQSPQDFGNIFDVNNFNQEEHNFDPEQFDRDVNQALASLEAAQAGNETALGTQDLTTGTEPMPATGLIPQTEPMPRTETLPGAGPAPVPGQTPAAPNQAPIIDITELIDPALLVSAPEQAPIVQPNPLRPFRPDNILQNPAPTAPGPASSGNTPRTPFTNAQAPQPTPGPTAGRVNSPTQTLGPRTHARQPQHPTRIELHRQLEPWGGIFSYNRAGELLPGLTLTAPELTCFIQNNPRRARLRLIIQNAPFPLAERYQDSLSTRCRLRGCPVHGNIISPGQFRVAIDEQPEPTAHRSPYIAAAFVHLWCIERYLDFPRICHSLPVFVEDRPDYLFEGSNIVKLGTENCKTIARNFIGVCKVQGDLSYGRFNYPRHDHWIYPGSLSWRLGFQFWRDNTEWVADRIMPYKGDIQRLPDFSRRGLHGAH